MVRCYPDSGAVAGALVIVVVWWGIGLRDGLHPAALIASAGLVAAACGGDRGGSRTRTPSRSTGESWCAGRSAVCWSWLSTPLAWGVAVLVRDQPAPAGIWLAGLVAALAGLLTANLLFTRGPG